VDAVPAARAGASAGAAIAERGARPEARCLIRGTDTGGGYAKEPVDTRQPFELVGRQVGVDELANLRRPDPCLCEPPVAGAERAGQSAEQACDVLS
jgi:hypothetical protein